MDAGGVVAMSVGRSRPVGRTARVVGALILAMGSLTLVLLVLEPGVHRLTPLNVVATNSRTSNLTRCLTQTNIPIQTQTWRRAVVVAAPLTSTGPQQPFCHFVVYPDGEAEATDAWVNQVRASRDDDRVHVLVRADWSACYPQRVQNETLVSLLRLVYQLGQPREWEAVMDVTCEPQARKRADWMHKVAANVVALPPR